MAKNKSDEVGQKPIQDNLMDAEAQAETPDHSEKANSLMKEQNVKEIWRCPVTGYWFTRKDYADDQAKKAGKSLEHYKL